MSVSRLSYLALASLVLLSACGGDDDGGSTPVDLTGTWSYLVDVTVANGPCAGEEDATPDPFLVDAVAHPNGDGSWFITVSGFIDNPNSQVTGTFTGTPSVGDEVTLSGSYPEDGGTTTSTHHLTIKSATRLEGTEDWTWTGPGGTCEGGKSNMVVTRVP